MNHPTLSCTANSRIEVISVFQQKLIYFMFLFDFKTHDSIPLITSVICFAWDFSRNFTFIVSLNYVPCACWFDYYIMCISAVQIRLFRMPVKKCPKWLTISHIVDSSYICNKIFWLKKNFDIQKYSDKNQYHFKYP